MQKIMAYIMTMNTPLLTIAIPTYNRAGFLDTCLDHIARQIDADAGLLEVLVSNNSSTDNTKEIVDKYVAMGVPIKYVENSENIGGERNVIQCFSQAGGRYLLIIGDDDLLLAGSLKKILQVLTRDEYGMVFLNSYGFTDDYLAERPGKCGNGVSVFTDPEQYLKKVHYWITFLSGNIVNRGLIAAEVDPDRFSGSNLPQLSWFIPAIFKARKNAFLEEYIVAFRAFNTGGYKLCQVFAENLNDIFSYFIANGYQRKSFDYINSKLLLTFFPNLLLIMRKQSKGFNFEAEDHFNVLKKVYGNSPAFWLVIVPVIKLPFRLAKMWAMLVARLSG